MTPEMVLALLRLIAKLEMQVETLAADNLTLRAQVEALTPTPEVPNPNPPCPEHGPVQVRAGGPTGPLVCPSCPNTVPA